jgi:hypothetical protein
MYHEDGRHGDKNGRHGHEDGLRGKKAVHRFLDIQAHVHLLFATDDSPGV